MKPLIPLLLVAALPVFSFARDAAPIRPLDAMLTDYAYPHEVKVRKFSDQGQALEMAYMDVPPAKDANGKAVLLLHGKNFSGSYWETTISALTDQGFRVIVPDQIGFG